MFRTCVVRFAASEVDVVGEILPRSADARHERLSAKFALGSDFARDSRDFGGERAQLLNHRVQSVLQQQDFAANVDGDLLREVAIGDGCRNLRDVSDLSGEIGRHEVDVVGEVLPRSGDAWHERLAAELALGSDFAGDAGHFGGESVELIHHRVDRVLELENLSLHVDGDLARESPRATAVVTSAIFRT